MNAKFVRTTAVAMIVALAGCASPSGTIEVRQPPQDIPEPTVVNRHTLTFPPELVVTRIACIPQMVGSREKLEVVATIQEQASATRRRFSPGTT